MMGNFQTGYYHPSTFAYAMCTPRLTELSPDVVMGPQCCFRIERVLCYGSSQFVKSGVISAVVIGGKSYFRDLPCASIAASDPIALLLMKKEVTPAAAPDTGWQSELADDLPGSDGAALVEPHSIPPGAPVAVRVRGGGAAGGRVVLVGRATH